MPLPVPRTSVVFRELPEGAVLFCTATETYFSLNPVGARVWKLLPPECQNEAELVARLSREHSEIDAGVIATDVRQLLADLGDHGLVEVRQPA